MGRSTIFLSHFTMRSVSLVISLCVIVKAFIPRIHRSAPSLVLKSTPDSDPTSELTQIGSKEYYEGFLKSDLRDDSTNNSERGDGLEQALKLGLYSAGVLGLLLLGFLASNGLLST